MDVVLRTSDSLLRDLLQLLDSLPCVPEGQKPSNWVLDGLNALVAASICYPRSICFRYGVLWSHSAVAHWTGHDDITPTTISFLLETLDNGFTEGALSSFFLRLLFPSFLSTIPPSRIHFAVSHRKALPRVR